MCASTGDVLAQCLDEDAPQAALGFIDALEAAYNHIGGAPGMGWARYAHELNLPGLYFWPLTHCPHLVFRDDFGYTL